MPHTYPKKARIVILSDKHGRTKFLLAAQYRLRALDEQRKGFEPIARLNVPLRRLQPRNGCWRYYHYFIAHLSDA
jgi:hypothetical protein